MTIDDRTRTQREPERRWFQTPHAGHISAVFWRSGSRPVVLVHDRGGAATDWASVAAALPSPAVGIDLPGHGRSSVALELPPVRQAARALVDAVHSFAPDAQVVIGQGYGGAVAIEAARQRPDVVRAVIVVAGTGDESWISGDEVAALTVPLAVVIAGDDPLVATILAASPAIDRVELDAPAGELLGVAAGSLADVIAPLAETEAVKR